MSRTVRLYFAADASHFFLNIPSPPPPSLWVKPRGVGRPLVACWLLTPATFALLLWRERVLAQRHDVGGYPAERLAEVRDRLAPITRWAWVEDGLAEVGGSAAIQAAWDALVAAGGPPPGLAGKLQPPPPCPALPREWDRDAPPPPPPKRWNGSRMRWEDV